MTYGESGFVRDQEYLTHGQSDWDVNQTQQKYTRLKKKLKYTFTSCGHKLDQWCTCLYILFVYRMEFNNIRR